MKLTSSLVLAIIACVVLSPFATTLALATNGLSEARMAAVNGDHALCAKISNNVRNLETSSWYAHQVFASCQSLNARENRNKLGAEKFKAEAMKAIEAIEYIISNSRSLTSRQRIKLSHMAVEMRKRLTLDLSEMTAASP